MLAARVCWPGLSELQPVKWPVVPARQPARQWMASLVFPVHVLRCAMSAKQCCDAPSHVMPCVVLQAVLVSPTLPRCCWS